MFASLDRANVSAMEPRLKAQLFLRPFSFLSQVADPTAKLFSCGSNLHITPKTNKKMTIALQTMASITINRRAKMMPIASINMEINNRTLFFGDNLEILGEKIPIESIDLIYLDPPFNSNRNYNVLFKEGFADSTAQIQAFEDTWEWTPITKRLFDDLVTSPNPQISILVNGLYESFHDSPMMSYLVNMTARLIPLKNVLKSTGSIYLHCDTTASHYLKILMDTIFGATNFRSQIIWKRQSAHSDTKQGRKAYGNITDIILYYTKSDDYTFNTQFTPYTEDYIETFYKFKDPNGRRYALGDLTGPGGAAKGNPYYEVMGVSRYWRFSKEKMNGLIANGRVIQTQPATVPLQKRYLDEMSGIPLQNLWTDIKPIHPHATERLGYPTQKPESLLERIISVSSDENDVILDPFCGGGTTVAVAEKLGRKWVGIDISMQAVNIIKERMAGHYNGIKINIDGIPMDYQAAQNLAERDKFAFQDWAISLVKANPPTGETKKGADRGIDGIILFHERTVGQKPKLQKIIVQVKGGNTGRGDVAKLKGDMERESAPMGILITLNEPTSEMTRETTLAGDYKYNTNVTFPKIQVLSIKDWFEGKEVKLPTDTVNPFRKAAPIAPQQSLF